MHTNKVIIVIGLPGSGKSHWISQNKSPNALVFDDFIRTFYDGHVLRALYNDNHPDIYLCDPRLCLPSTFKDFIIDRGILNYNPEIVLFENNPDKCINNIRRRGSHRDGPSMERTIREYSKHYQLKNYSLCSEVVPVYSGSGLHNNHS